MVPPLSPEMEAFGWIMWIFLAFLVGTAILVTLRSSSCTSTQTKMGITANTKSFDETIGELLQEIKMLRKEIEELRKEFRE